ncbi:SipW-dependent-type signal peptide-containing protein [Prescottella agglutinans]|uniref:SipW-dependent-type signal peptide-containing protein n=1 Tax=Prescottella agglutinans TaxID=1644129 RepID=UPI003D9932A7
MSRDEISNSTPTVGARMRKTLGGGRVRAALSLGIVLGLGSVGTLAAWSDTATATSGVFKTAAIDLKLGPAPGTDSYAFSAFSGSGLLPGSTVQAPLEIRNAGDLAFNYSMTARAAGNTSVAGQIALTVFPNSNCSGNALGNPVTMSTTDQTLIANKGQVAATSGVDTICIRATAGNSLTKAMQNQSINVVFTLTATSV